MLLYSNGKKYLLRYQGKNYILYPPTLTPSGYTLTINPTPADATITLTAEGYTQSGNSITVPSGTIVSLNMTSTNEYFLETNKKILVDKDLALDVEMDRYTCLTGGSISGFMPYWYFAVMFEPVVGNICDQARSDNPGDFNWGRLISRNENSITFYATGNSGKTYTSVYSKTIVKNGHPFLEYVPESGSYGTAYISPGQKIGDYVLSNTYIMSRDNTLVSISGNTYTTSNGLVGKVNSWTKENIIYRSKLENEVE